MKCTIPEISWHNRDPVLTADIQNNCNNNYRLATGGTDCHVVIWQLCILDNGGVSVEMLSDLTHHNRAVNAVRFSPDGQILASSDDESAIILWRKQEDSSNDIFLEDSEVENKEHWSLFKMLRGHIEDIYDLCWSSCSQYLISGSVDNSAILWDVHKGKKIGLLNDHKGFVQGVAWDPQGQYVSTLCSDRCLRVYNITSKKIVHKICKTNFIAQDAGNTVNQKTSRLFYDDTLKSFCRRLCFSPDGELLLAPSGILEDADGKFVNVVHIFTRSSMPRPVTCLPTDDKYTIAVRFCPILFQLREKKTPAGGDKEATPFVDMFNLPYRMVFAFATQNSVLIYDTQQPIPLAKISNIHYTRLSDITWSGDGRVLVVSSTDGYCSLISFTENELGVPYTPPSPKEKEIPHTVVTEDKKPKQSSKSCPKVEVISVKRKAKTNTLATPTEDVLSKDRGVVAASSVKQTSKGQSKPVKRVQLITLSEKSKKVTSDDKNSEISSKMVEHNIDEVPNATEASKVSDVSVKTEEAPLIRTPRRVALITLSSPKNAKGLTKEL